MENIKAYQVKEDWEVFRLPNTNPNKLELYNYIQDWCEKNCQGQWKIFKIEGGYGNLIRYNSTDNKLEKTNYFDLIQVDLLDKNDAALFKLTFGV